MTAFFKNITPRIDSVGVMCLIFFALVTCPVMGQGTQKLQLTHADYKRWSHLSLNAISDDGAWVSYSLNYEATDTVFVKHTDTEKKYAFLNAVKNTFAASQTVVSLDKSGTLSVLNLTNGGLKTTQNVKRFEIVSNRIITLSNGTQNNLLQFFNLNLDLIFEMPAVAEYKINPNKTKVAIITISEGKNGISIVDFEGRTVENVVMGDPKKHSRLEWAADGKSLFFLSGETGGYTLHHFDLASKIANSLTDEKISTLLPGMQIEPRALKAAKSGLRVYFTLKNIKPADSLPQSNVQVWNTYDKWIFPAEADIDGWNVAPKMAMWEPDTQRLTQLTDNGFPRGYVTGNNNYLISYNPQVYEPQFNELSNVTYYITDLRTGVRTKWLSGSANGETDIFMAPDANHISYFRDGHWYVYVIASGTHYKATQNIQQPLAEIAYDKIGASPAYGSPGWSADGKWLLVYDEYDIWKVSVDGKKAIRLTKGREEQVSYRVVVQRISEKITVENRGITLGKFDLAKGIIIKGIGDGHSSFGYFGYKEGKPLQSLGHSANKLEFFTRSANESTAGYIEQSNNLPPRIIINKGGKRSVLVESNPQHFNYYNKAAERIAYRDTKNNLLNGILYFPAHYDTGKKYPMIVHVYEKQSAVFHDYIVPSIHSEDGFNVANLTAKGYLVFLPDIVYEAGNPGPSALDCVTASVNAVLLKGIVDAANIGIIGHSFGGFETAYIASQSSLFKSAVAGSAMTDFISGSYSLWKNARLPNYVKIETGQARLNKTIFDDSEMYLKNSPVFHANAIGIPLLTWTGDSDPQVDASQSFEMYFALRRLAKEHIMLVYPGEGHALMDKNNKADLTAKIEDWFDFHLKGYSRPKWMDAK